jgi:hypothetical protein
MSIFDDLEGSTKHPRQPASATVNNKTPSGWDAVISEVGLVFRFQNAQGQLVQPDEQVIQPCSVASGGSITVYSKREGCCQDMYVVAKVAVPGEQPQFIGGWTGSPAGPAECKIHCDMDLAPKRNVARGDMDPLLCLIVQR